MSADNTATIVGNVARDIEIRFTSGGQAVSNFSVAVNRRWQNRQTQEWEEEVSFFDVTCWQHLAENVSETISKGDRVVVTGRLHQNNWENQDGEKRSKVEIVADDVAPSLRWATAVVTRNERQGDGQTKSSTGGGRSGGRSGATSRGRSQASAPSEPFGDESPF